MQYLHNHNLIASMKLEDIYALNLLSPLLLGLPFTPFTGSALRPYCLVHVLNDIVVNQRTRIIEFGAGISTILMGRMIKLNSLPATVVTVEHDEQWSNLISKEILKEDLSSIIQVVCAPLSWYLAVFFEQVKTRDFLTLTVQI